MMTLLEFIKVKIIGPLVTNLICMPWFRSFFEDLSDIQSFNLCCARNIRISVQNDEATKDVVSSVYQIMEHHILNSFKNIR